MTDKKKKVYTVLAVILICLLAFGVYWKASSFSRYRSHQMEGISNSISSDSMNMWFGLSSDENGYRERLLEDSKFQAFVSAKLQEICDKNELDLVTQFLKRLEYEGCKFQTVFDIAKTYYENLGIEDALEASTALKSSSYYAGAAALTKNSPVISTYIEEQGTHPITLTEGKGYYAKKSDSYYKKRIGIDGSPLYDSYDTSYYGDFKCQKESGVKLNSYYEEVGYNTVTYYFRDERIDFDPTDGECVWTGEYLLHFSDTGELTDYEKLRL